MKRKIYFTLFIFFVAIIAFTINSEAAYQSRPNFSSLVNTTTNSFFENIRKMESADGPMGLNAEFTVSDTEVKETSASNNIDVHMIKNSEWGAAVLLASSGYGAGRDDDAGIWTTGPNNYTGIYGMGNSNWEYTASYCQKGGSTITGSTNYRSLLHSYQGTKYVDQYVNKNNQATADYDSFTVIKGDTIINVMNLHSRISILLRRTIPYSNVITMVFLLSIGTMAIATATTLHVRWLCVVLDSCVKFYFLKILLVQQVKFLKSN